jgi:hypothetical protein
VALVATLIGILGQDGVTLINKTLLQLENVL